MKKFLLLLLFPVYVQAQFETTSNDFAVLKDLKISVLNIKDVKADTLYKSINIRYVPKKKLYNASGYAAISIDYSELDEIINNLRYVNNMVSSNPPDKETNFDYSTNAGVSISATYYPKGKVKGFSGWSVGIYKIYKHLRTTEPGTNIKVDPADINTLINIFENAIKL